MNTSLPKCVAIRTTARSTASLNGFDNVRGEGCACAIDSAELELWEVVLEKKFVLLISFNVDPYTHTHDRLRFLDRAAMAASVARRNPRAGSRRASTSSLTSEQVAMFAPQGVDPEPPTDVNLRTWWY
jgi:hypothetical protein